MPIAPIKCLVCGKSYLVPAQQAGRAKYCSRACVLKYQRDNEVHKKGKLMELTCDGCGEKFRVRSSMAKVQKYCSKECSYKYHKTLKGPDNPKWKEKVSLTCRHCGKQFKTYPCRVGRRNYCCHKHAILGNLQRLASGARTDIEIKMADALTENGIEFEEQVTLFDKFMVDFLLLRYPIIIQCDGNYWHNRPSVKARDKGQDKYIKKAGYMVLRFTDTEINKSIDLCIKKINETISQAPLRLL